MKKIAVAAAVIWTLYSYNFAGIGNAIWLPENTFVIKNGKAAEWGVEYVLNSVNSAVHGLMPEVVCTKSECHVVFANRKNR